MEDPTSFFSSQVTYEQGEFQEPSGTNAETGCPTDHTLRSVADGVKDTTGAMNAILADVLELYVKTKNLLQRRSCSVTPCMRGSGISCPPMFGDYATP